MFRSGAGIWGEKMIGFRSGIKKNPGSEKLLSFMVDSAIIYAMVVKVRNTICSPPP
jgi:hypothetical protein